MQPTTATRHVTLVGSTPLAKRLFALLQSQPDVVVRAAASCDEASTRPADVVVEATGGLTPAYAVAMAALGRGIPCVTANALLMMVHGKVLTTASRGQHAGLYATAALGAAAPLVGWLRSVPLRGLQIALPTAANASFYAHIVAEKAVLRRLPDKDFLSADRIHFSNLDINIADYTITTHGLTVPLTVKEMELLWCLASSPSRTFSREILLEKVWGYEYYGDTRTVDVHIRHLRAKLKAVPAVSDGIETVRGVGYRFVRHEGLQESI